MAMLQLSILIATNYAAAPSRSYMIAGHNVTLYNLSYDW